MKTKINQLILFAALALSVSAYAEDEPTCAHTPAQAASTCTEAELQDRYGFPVQRVDLEAYDGLLKVQIQTHVPNYQPHPNASYAVLYMQTKRRVLAKALLGGFAKGAQSFYVYTFNADGELIGWDKNTVAI